MKLFILKKMTTVAKSVSNQILRRLYDLISISGDIDLRDLINYKYSDSEDEEPPEKPELKPAEEDLLTNSEYSDSEEGEVPEKPENKGEYSDSEVPEIKGEAENSVELIIDYAEPLDN